MKLKDRRLILVTGLALALNWNNAVPAHAAGPISKRTVKLAQAPTDATPDATIVPPRKPTQAPSPTPPLSPTPDPLLGKAVDPSTPPASPTVTTAPLQLGTEPALSPTQRPPMGLLFGEESPTPNVTPRPLPPPGAAPPVQAAPTMQGAPAEAPPGSPVIGAPAEFGVPGAITDRFGMSPPPGTLGQTYKRRSRLIEDTKHPRVGAVEINLPEWVDVTSPGLKPKWNGKFWRLESDPLIPGIPHIYQIKASWGEGTEPQYRTVRLIMGRIVDLEFQ